MHIIFNFFFCSYRWGFWKSIPKENWCVVYRDRLIIELKIHHALESISQKYYNNAEVHRKEFDTFVHLANGNPALSCHVNDTLCELIQGDDW